MSPPAELASSLEARGDASDQFLARILGPGQRLQRVGEKSSFAFWVASCCPTPARFMSELPAFAKKPVALYFEIGAEDGTKHTLNI
jgi:hypothetical protein